MLQSIKQEVESLLVQAGGKWGVVIEDLTKGERIAWNEEERFFAASVIKVPIMTAIFAAVFQGKFAFNDRIVLRQEDRVGGSGVLQHMTPGTELTIWDLVTLMIIQSDNTATNLLIDLAGKDAVRGIMAKTGMSNSRFYNKLMIIPAELEGYNEVTAADMASHYRHLGKGTIISYNSCLQMIQILKRQQFRDCLPKFLPDPETDVIGTIPRWEMAHKTGWVSNNVHDTGILYVKQSAVILSVLSQGVEHHTARETMGRIGKLVYDLYPS